MSAALKRVEAALDARTSRPWQSGDLLGMVSVNIADLRTVLRLAKSAAELRRRIKLMLVAARLGSVPLADCRDWYVSDLADLRKPLPKRKPLSQRRR